MCSKKSTTQTKPFQIYFWFYEERNHEWVPAHYVYKAILADQTISLISWHGGMLWPLSFWSAVENLVASPSPLPLTLCNSSFTAGGRSEAKPQFFVQRLPRIQKNTWEMFGSLQMFYQRVVMFLFCFVLPFKKIPLVVTARGYKKKAFKFLIIWIWIWKPSVCIVVLLYGCNVWSIKIRLKKNLRYPTYVLALKATLLFFKFIINY